MDVEFKEKQELLKNFGIRLNSLIYARYKSKDAFVITTGIYKPNLHRIIIGKSDPQLTTLVKIAKGLEVSLSDLFAEL